MSDYWATWTRAKRSRRQVLKALGAGAGLATLTGLGVGCGSDSGDNGTMPTTGGTPSGEPIPGGTLRYANPYEPPHLDVVSILAVGTHTSIGPVYSKLLRFRAGEGISPTDFTLEPDLAERYEIPEENVFVFTLRREVKYQNVPPVNGREFTAEDVKYTFARILAPETASPQRYIFEAVDKYEVVDPYTLRVTLKRPQAVFLHHLGGSYTWIIARELAEADQLKSKAVGTGPFILEEYAPGNRLIFRKNPDYYVQGQPYLDRIERPIVQEYSTRLNAYRSGEADISPPMNNREDVESLSGRDSKVWESTTAGGGFVFLNQRPSANTIFRDERVRQALLLAADYEELRRIAYRGTAHIQGPLPAAFGEDWALQPDELLEKFYIHDVKRAKQLLEAAGAANTRMDGIQYNYGQQYLSAAQVFVRQWEAIGFHLSISEVEYARSIESLQNPGSNLTVNVSPQSPFTSVDEWLGQFRSGHPRNHQGVTDDELDAMIDKFSQSLDDEERKPLAKEIQRRILEKAYAIPLLNPQSWTAMRTYVHGYANHQGYGELALPKTWIEA